MSNFRPKKHSEKNYRARIVFNERSQKKEELTTFASCKLFDDIGRFVSY